MMPASESSPTTVDRLTAVLSYGILLLLGYLIFRVFEPFLVPLAWAGVLVVFFHPLYERLSRRMTPTQAALAAALVVTILLIVPALALLSLFIREALSATAVVQRAMMENQVTPLTRLSDWLQQHVHTSFGYDLPTLLRQGAERLGAFLALQVGPFLRNVAAFVFDFCVVLLAMVYFFRDSKRLVKTLRNLLPFEPVHQQRVLDESRDLIVGSVLVTMVVAGIQGTLGGLAFTIVGLPTPFFWGVAMAFFSLVPVVGTALVWVPAALWLGWTGHWGKALILAMICVAVVGAADNILRPILLRGRTQLSGLLVFISVFGGVRVFGLLGIVLGPIVVATVAGILDVYAHSANQPADG
ncbi:MAG: AI-2E family transporter [Candidatus Acidiferrales bacterium]|jgi:predicted PurR-regulated permease PerM